MHVSVSPNSHVEVPASPALPVRLHPFRGVRLSPQRVAHPAVARAFARPYHEVAQRLLEWEEQGFVQVDDTPAFYLHEYSVTGITIRGLVGTLDLATRATSADDRAVFAHEGIHPDQADELADRMLEMGINPAPILLVHHGSQALRDHFDALQRLPADHDYEDRSGQHHRLWRITSAASLELLERELATTRLMIADGHHRYAAYLRLQENNPGTPWDRGLAMVVDQDDTPFFLGAIHRTLLETSLEDVVAAVRAAGGEAVEVTQQAGIKALGEQTWLIGHDDAWFAVRTPGAIAPVQFLHGDVLTRLPAQPTIEFHHAADQALSSAPDRSTTVLLPAPSYALLDHSMEHSTLLPEKATSFQPKPNIGVLMRSVDSELLAPLG